MGRASWCSLSARRWPPGCPREAAAAGAAGRRRRGQDHARLFAGDGAGPPGAQGRAAGHRSGAAPALGLGDLGAQRSALRGAGLSRPAARGGAAAEQTLRRWAIKSRIGHDDNEHLLGNPFFELLADGLAASTDALTAGRLVEWAEREPDLDNLIVDTAPGLPALEFLAKPDKIIALLEGRLLGWLGGRAGPAGLLGSLAQKLHVPRFAGGLVRLAGLGAFTEVGQMVTQLEACFATFHRRVGVARDWFREPSTQLLLVGGGGRTDDCLELAGALARQGLRPRAVLLNRALSAPLLEAVGGDGLPEETAPEARAFLAWLRAIAAAQTQAVSQLQTLGLPIATAPRAASASGTPGLLQIGATLLAQLEGGGA